MDMRLLDGLRSRCLGLLRQEVSRVVVYELWDVEIGNALARYEGDRDMAALVRALVSRNGVSYAEDLDLTIEDTTGTVIEQLTGPLLVEWANTVLHHANDPAGAGGFVASKISAAREDRLVEELRRAHGLSEEEARRLLPRLHRLQVLDAVAPDAADEDAKAKDMPTHQAESA